MHNCSKEKINLNTSPIKFNHMEILGFFKDENASNNFMVKAVLRSPQDSDNSVQYFQKID